MTKFSVVIPTFNRAATLERALDSVLNQTLKNWELIIVDDGSTDLTQDLVSAWQARNPEIVCQYVHTPNRGVSAARNAGARQARGTWLAFLDSDDEWMPHKLELQDALTANFVWIHSGENWIRNGVRVNAGKKHEKSGGRVFERAVDICFISPSTSLIRKDIFAEENGFREDFPVCEDYELWLRLAAKYPVGFLPHGLIHKYGGHADQLSRKYFAMDYYRAKALIQFLDCTDISEAERQHVIAALLEKCEILIRGYEKHGNTENLDEVQDWVLAVRSRFTAAHNAHSAIDLRPRSELKGIL